MHVHVRLLCGRGVTIGLTVYVVVENLSCATSWKGLFKVLGVPKIDVETSKCWLTWSNVVKLDIIPACCSKCPSWPLVLKLNVTRIFLSISLEVTNYTTCHKFRWRTFLTVLFKLQNWYFFKIKWVYRPFYYCSSTLDCFFKKIVEDPH